MNKILTVEQLSNFLQNAKKKRLVLVGGVFDLLHEGHTTFLNEAKRYGDLLLVLLESDENVRKYKGESRPIYPQKERAERLVALSAVDAVVLLKNETNNQDYDHLVLRIKPAIIATTKGDPKVVHKKRQCKMLGIPLVEISHIPGFSTTQVLKDLQNR